MSYNYLIDTIDGSVGCANNQELSKSQILYNGKLKNEINSHSDYTEVAKLNGTVTEPLDEKKSRFSEKLKLLLKNGGGKTEQIVTDPYAFSEIDSQYGSIKKALSNVNSGLGKTSPISPNFPVKRSIVSFRPVKEEEKECNGDVLKKAVPAFTMISSSLSQKQASPIDRFKVSSLKNGRTLSSVPLPSASKPLLNKLLGKSKLQNLKANHLNNSFKGNRMASGKPFSFNQSHLHKQGSGKVEKKLLGNKQRSVPKGKSLLNQLQKTAYLNRGIMQPIRKDPSKQTFFGMAKPKETDGSSLVPKTAQRKSLLEESLLGLKKKSLTNDNLRIESNMGKGNERKSITETGSTTVLTTPRSRTESLDQGKHESLERIWDIRNKLKGLKRDHHHFGLALSEGDNDENSDSECLLFQNYWFSVCNDYESISNNDRKRDTKLSQLKVELRHKIKQLQWRYKDEYRDKVVELLVDSARKQPNLTAFLIRLDNSKFNNRKKVSRIKPFNLLKPVLCSFTNVDLGQKCTEQAMPCVKYCQQHITCSNDQLLFTGCSAKRNDNTTCNAAVLNQNVENPLCLQHKRLENMSEMPKKILNSKPLSRPPQPRKRSRSSTSSSRSGRSRKRKRSGQKDRKEGSSESVSPSGVTSESSVSFSFVQQSEDESDTLKSPNALTKITPQIISKCDIDESQEVEVGEEVLAIAEDLPLELASQATKLLEEHDFTNVLNHIPPEAFNDLFTEDKEEYEPTQQETEELERALEAVDKDVKSLEKLSQTQGILDTLLDEQTIAQTLAQLPEVTANLEVPQTLVPVFYHNGFSNINQLEQTLHDVNKSLSQAVLINQGSEGLTNHFVNNLTIPNHADVLQS